MQRLSLFVLTVGMMFAFSITSTQAGVIWTEDFDAHPNGAPLLELPGWSAGKADASQLVTATVGEPGHGNGGKALAVSCTAACDPSSQNFRLTLPTPVSGTVWLSFRFRTPGDSAALIGGLFVQPMEFLQIAAGTGVDGYRRPRGNAEHLAFTANWGGNRAWRMQNAIPFQGSRWHRLTIKMDTAGELYSAWIDDRPLAEGAYTKVTGPVTGFILGTAGTATDPVLLDDFTVAGAPPAGLVEKPLFPPHKPGRLFRFIGLGDPQLGFTKMEYDVARLREAVRQINMSGADFTVIAGDLVDEKEDDASYKTFLELAKALAKPWYPVRGNHDEPERYREYFGKDLDYSFEHEGIRFVMFDQDGHRRGIPAERLAWIEKEFRAARAAGQTIIACCHCSPWQDNARGLSEYMQIGEGREELLALQEKYGVLISLHGHYHRGPWHHEDNGVNYLVLGGTSKVRYGQLGFCIFDVYDDRIEVHHKNLWFAAEDAGAVDYYDDSYRVWNRYDEWQQKWPYIMRSPLIVKRTR